MNFTAAAVLIAAHIVLFWGKIDAGGSLSAFEPGMLAKLFPPRSRAFAARDERLKEQTTGASVAWENAQLGSRFISSS